MNWGALTKKQQQIVAATVVLAFLQILLLAYFMGWINPAKSADVKKELRDLQAKLTEAAQIISREADIRVDLRAGRDRLEKLAAYVPDSSDPYAWAYEYLSLRAAQTGLEIDSLEQAQLAEADKENAARPYEINMSTRCGLDVLTDFLWRIETGNPLLRIREITISLIPDDPLRQQVRLVLQWPSEIVIDRTGI